MRRIGDKKDYLQEVETIRVEETSLAVELSSNGCEEKDEQMVQAGSKKLASEPEEAVTSVPELMPSRLAT